MGSFFTKGAGGDAASEVAAGNQAGIDEIKRQFDITQANVDPFIEAGTTALGRVETGSTLSGFGSSLDAILNDPALDPLVEARTADIEARDAASGNFRSGEGLENAAAITSDLAIELEDLLFGRTQDLSTQGLEAGLGLGSLGAEASSDIAGLLSDTGKARSSGLLADAETKTGNIDQLAETAATVLPLVFGSDPDLKENIEEIGEVTFQDSSKSLKIYQWDWIKGTKSTFLESCPKIGFMADEVKEKYPQHVIKVGGFDMIKYFALLRDLDAENQLELEVA